jgi:proteasome lid subunit RPN8/RPN11
MDVARVGPSPHRVPDATPLPDATRVEGAGEYAERPMPMVTAVRWIPVGQSGVVDPIHPIFITHAALAGVQAQSKAPPDAASFGFLVGDVYIAPETRTPYVVVDSVIHSGWSRVGDHLTSALLEGRALVEEEVSRSGRRLVGWYQTHAAADPRLSAADVDAHLACFNQPWDVALVIAGSAGLAGGVFRVASKTARSDQFLPFYELVEGDSLPGEGRKVTALSWGNYRPPGLAFPPVDARRSPSRPLPRLLMDEALDADALASEALRRVRPQRRIHFPLLQRRQTRMIGLGLVVAAALFWGYRAAASGVSAVDLPLASVTHADPVHGLADTVSFAVAAFDLRTIMYTSRKMGCADLAGGLIELEDRWIAYSVARRNVATTVDPAAIADDRRLRDDVDAAERAFARTGCPRP